MSDVDRQSEMLCNRVRKTKKHLRRWLEREGITCYRLYDRDIPEIPLVIDWYQGRLHVAEFQKADVDDDKRGREWMQAVLQQTVAELGVPENEIYYKIRDRQRGQTQYQAKGTDANRVQVQEGGLQFWVNLVDYLDTGLFLDHRETRKRFAAEASRKAVLNLYCYTASFSVLAAAAGAATTLSIDLSHTYLDWARANFNLNGLDVERNRLHRADVMEELALLHAGGERFDLVIVDPPTFSNSKSLLGVFDVQRDHVALLLAVRKLLAGKGVVYFSTNHRRFRMDQAALASAYELTETSTQTLPRDFRDPKIHRSWRLSAAAKAH